jgi:beta-glucanase (GH16 family)
VRNPSPPQKQNHSNCLLTATQYCLILNDKFTTIDDAVWSHEVAVGGFGYGSFDWTTSDPANSYVSSSGLHIVPTITTDSTDITSDQLLNGYTLDLQSDGTCTSPDASQCIRTSNSSQTNGTIINPVRSARLTTAGKLSIKYGRIEVVAKMPKGDWLWPQIWLYPETETYGPFPRSGQIDLAGLRGNSYQSYIPSLGRDTVSSALHWGPMPALDQSWQTSGKLTMRRQDLAAGWHTYGLEWSETQLWTWIDSRVYQVVHMGFGPSYGGNLYQRGGFGTMWSKDGGLPPDAWSQTGALNTPFDQPFHLVINLAVGASNGFFPDNKGNKPWLDGTASAMKDFWNAYGVWGATWGAGEDRGLTVRSVKVWQQGKCTA